jgi:hypothetical protein
LAKVRLFQKSFKNRRDWEEALAYWRSFINTMAQETTLANNSINIIPLTMGLATMIMDKISDCEASPLRATSEVAGEEAWPTAARIKERDIYLYLKVIDALLTQNPTRPRAKNGVGEALGNPLWERAAKPAPFFPNKRLATKYQTVSPMRFTFKSNVGAIPAGTRPSGTNGPKGQSPILGPNPPTDPPNQILGGERDGRAMKKSSDYCLQ